MLCVFVLLQRRRPAPKVEMGTSSHNDVDLSWIPQETLNQISAYLCDSLCPASVPLVLLLLFVPGFTHFSSFLLFLGCRCVRSAESQR